MPARNHSRRNGKSRGSAAGAGGELHQVAAAPEQSLTTNRGVSVSDDQNSLRVDARGPTLLEDFVLREKITHFDHEHIPERIVHARGSAAHGYFQVYRSQARLQSGVPAGTEEADAGVRALLDRGRRRRLRGSAA